MFENAIGRLLRYTSSTIAACYSYTGECKRHEQGTTLPIVRVALWENSEGEALTPCHATHTRKSGQQDQQDQQDDESTGPAPVVGMRRE